MTRQSSDTMEELDDHAMATINVPEKTEGQKAPTDAASSNGDETDKQEEEEKEGSLKDYFVCNNHLSPRYH